MTTTSTHHLLLLLHILLLHVPSSLSSAICLHHIGCYQDDRLLLQYTTTFHSYDTKRTAETCARLCLQRRPDTEVVLVKLEGVDELLSCGCGDDLTLGNHTGLTFDHLACYLCPDSEREKCGSDVTSSVYNLDRTGVEACGNSLLSVPPPITMTSTTTTTTTTTEEPPPKELQAPEPRPVQTYQAGSSNISAPSHNLTHESFVDFIGVTTLPHFRHLGCYDEDDVNETVVVTMVVKDGGYASDDDDGGGGGGAGVGGVKYCADNCSAAHPASAEVFLLKVLSAELLYCGCGKLAALPSSRDGGRSGQCALRCGEGQTATPLPCGGWTAVSAYERSGGARQWGASVFFWPTVYVLGLFLPLF